jgi:hypothetical protein
MMGWKKEKTGRLKRKDEEEKEREEEKGSNRKRKTIQYIRNRATILNKV